MLDLPLKQRSVLINRQKLQEDGAEVKMPDAMTWGKIIAGLNCNYSQNQIYKPSKIRVNYTWNKSKYMKISQVLL